MVVDKVLGLVVVCRMGLADSKLFRLLGDSVASHTELGSVGVAGIDWG